MRISDWSSDVCSSDLTVSRALRHKRAILARNTLPMPDYFHVETRTYGVFSSAGRALAKRRGKTRPVLNLIPVGEASAGGLISLRRFQALSADPASAKEVYKNTPRNATSSGRPIN